MLATKNDRTTSFYTLFVTIYIVSGDYVDLLFFFLSFTIRCAVNLLNYFLSFIIRWAVNLLNYNKNCIKCYGHVVLALLG